MKLPRYVQPTGDTLRLSDDAFAYGVKMAPVHPDHLDERTLFLVAEVGDSLFYRDIESVRQQGAKERETVSVRAFRFIEVPGAQSQYFWFEHERRHVSREDGIRTKSIRWAGHVLAYDSSRGVRYLHSAPVREKDTKNGKLVGVQQWDVSVPEPGIMLIEPRLKRGKVGRDAVRDGEGVMLGNREWLGRHVIDPTATSKREVEAEAGYRTIIDTTEVENWREKYPRY